MLINLMKNTFRPISLYLYLALSLLIVSSEFADDQNPEIQLTDAFPNIKLKAPIMIAIPPDGSNRHFLVQQTGKIYILPNDHNDSHTQVLLDISDRIPAKKANEEGLLNLSFHPKFKQNKKFYIHYTQYNPRRNVISEFRFSAADPDKADMTTERIIMELRQPFPNHNSGNMLFGPDGYLFICFGDGGKANDPHNLAQNLWVLYGKILRIDVDSRAGALQYGIPSDNPFVKTKGVRPEIWAYGLRNPWGIFIDPVTGDFWCADVGQILWEEIDIIVKGGNYGWNYYEGLHRFSLRTQQPPDTAEFIEPIYEYNHKDGLSITGGVVYRGKKIPDLYGWYVYADWKFGTIWALRYESGKVVQNVAILKPSIEEKIQPIAFNLDPDGEIYVLNWDGRIFKITKPD